MLAQLANPHRFMALSKPLIPAFFSLAALLLAIGLPLGLSAPPDYRQAETARIMFVHVPAAWTCMLAYGIMSLASALYLVFRSPLADAAARSAALPGAVFTLICLLTGSLWGRPIWNTWWEWDARMTSVLALLFIYIGYIALRAAHDTPARASGVCAVFCLVGAVNLPIIKFSVDWWNTLHQPASILRLGGPAMPDTYLIPLLVVACGYLSLLAASVLALMRADVFVRQADVLAMRRAGYAEKN